MSLSQEPELAGLLVMRPLEEVPSFSCTYPLQRGMMSASQVPPHFSGRLAVSWPKLCRALTHLACCCVTTAGRLTHLLPQLCSALQCPHAQLHVQSYCPSLSACLCADSGSLCIRAPLERLTVAAPVACPVFSRLLGQCPASIKPLAARSPAMEKKCNAFSGT